MWWSCRIKPIQKYNTPFYNFFHENKNSTSVISCDFFGIHICTVSTLRRPRGRDLGILFQGRPGPHNAITDIKGVEVGYHTLIQGAGPRAVRTGVTAILPRGNKYSPVYASWYSLNGNGELTGTTWVQGSGFLETPILITNTNSVGTVRDATLKWMSLNQWHKPNEMWYAYPVVGETYDGFLNDILGFHVKESHVLEALSSTKSGPVAEGNVGGGTGMVCLGFKGGTGTSSRVVSIRGKDYVVGVFVLDGRQDKVHFKTANRRLSYIRHDGLESILSKK